MTKGVGLEASEINDKEILSATRQMTRGDGALKFKITLTDGHKIESEWVNPDHKQKALQNWCEVVRGQVMARANAALEAEKERQLKAKQEAEAKKELIVPTGTLPVPSMAELPAMPVLPPVAAPPVLAGGLMTPLAMAQQQLALAQAAMQTKAAEYQQAVQLVQQWTQMVQQMQTIELSAGAGVIQIAKSLRNEG